MKCDKWTFVRSAESAGMFIPAGIDGSQSGSSLQASLSWYFWYSVHDVVHLGVFLYIIVWIFKGEIGEKILENLPGAAPAQLGTLKMEEIRMVFQVVVRNGKVCPAEEYHALEHGQKCR